MPRISPSPLLHPEGSFQINFPEFGCLDVRVGAHDVAFLSLFGLDRFFPSHPLAENHSFAHAVAATGRVALIAASDALYLFDASTVDLSRVAALERWDDLGFQHIEVHDLGDRFLCNFEQGLVALSYSGSELWRVSRIMWLWRFYGTRDGLLVFQDQDAEFHLFDSDTGEERAV